jgi:hypothetical protein
LLTKKEKDTSAGKKVAIPCPDSFNNIQDCLDAGCGPSLDPNDGEAESMTIQQMRNLPDSVPGFKICDTREALAALGGWKVDLSRSTTG